MFYFEENYIKKKNFKQKHENGEIYFTWSIYMNVMNDIVRTSNSFEGWHRSIKDRINHKNPGVDELVALLKDIQNITEIYILISLYGYLSNGDILDFIQ